MFLVPRLHLLPPNPLGTMIYDPLICTLGLFRRAIALTQIRSKLWFDVGTSCCSHYRDSRSLSPQVDYHPLSLQRTGYFRKRTMYDLPNGVKANIFRHLNYTSSPFSVAAFLPCLLVYRPWDPLIDSSMAREIVDSKANPKCQAIIKTPKRSLLVTQYMRSLNTLLRNEFDS